MSLDVEDRSVTLDDLMRVADAPAASRSKKRTHTAKERANRRPGNRAKQVHGRRRTWHDVMYKAARSGRLRQAMRLMEWDRTQQTPTMLSSRQAPALMPALVDTRPREYGYPAGIDTMTGRMVNESVFGLYRAGIVTTPNRVTFGDVGVTKSTRVKCEIARFICTEGGRAAVWDRKRQSRPGGKVGGEYDFAADVLDGTRLVFNQEPGKGCRINLFDPVFAVETTSEESQLGQDRLIITAAEHALDRSMDQFESRALSLAHRRTLALGRDEGRIPELVDFIKMLRHPTTDELLDGVTDEQLATWGLPVAVAMTRYIDGDLRGLIDGQTCDENGQPLNLDAPLLIMDTSALGFGTPQLGIIMAVTTAYLMSVWIQVPNVQKMVVLEEGYSADGLGVVPALFRDIAKRSRGVGASLWAVFHHISDIPKDSPLRSLITEAELIDVYRQGWTADAAEIVELLDLEPRLQETLTLLPKGVCLRRRGSGKILPTTFLELVRSPLEVEMTYTDDAMGTTA